MVRAPRETICALATADGPGAIAVVRISGPDTRAVLDRVFPGSRPSCQPARTARPVWFHDERGRPLDQVVLTLFREPDSYTGEDLAEVSCHGGGYVVNRVLRVLRRQGCRPAQPGEFTRRAVLAGKLTLAQAEAVLDLVNARTESGLRSALGRYRGDLGRAVAGLREELADVAAEFEYRIGFEEEDTPRPARLDSRVRALARRLARAAAAATANSRLFRPPAVVIVGRPNVGKSSLFNRLVGRPRSIVTPTPGTTRDRVEAEARIGRALVRLIDTGGLGTRSPGPIGRQTGVQTGAALADADFVLVVLDGSAPARPADRQALRAASEVPSLAVINKSDLPQRLDRSTVGNGRRPSAVSVSALRGTNLPRLRRLLARRLSPSPASPFAGPRQAEALAAAGEALDRTLAAPNDELATFELRTALDQLAAVENPIVGEELLDRVFARFCVGK